MSGYYRSTRFTIYMEARRATADLDTTPGYGDWSSMRAAIDSLGSADRKGKR